MTRFAATGLMKSLSGASARFGRILRAAPLRLVLPIGAVVALVAGLVLVLPSNQTAADIELASYAPLIEPSAGTTVGQEDVALDTPFRIQFTKPMNAPSVEQSLKITPAAEVNYRWDATDQTLALAPKTHWDPHTAYRVQVGSSAVDLEGLALKAEMNAVFQTGDLTAGQYRVTQTVRGLASPRTSFELTFTRPVKYSTVVARVWTQPSLALKVLGDDPTDQASTVFTITPNQPLDTGSKYTLNFEPGGSDSSGSTIKAIEPLTFETLPTPAIVTFTPGAGAISRDNHQPITIAFSTNMDTKATEAAIFVTDSGHGVQGTFSWSDDHTAVTFTPRTALFLGSGVSLSVSTAARSEGGIPIAEAGSVNFSIAAPRARRIAYVPPKPIKWENVGPVYLSAEKYYLELMNCTRTGGWVVGGGMCSSVTNHTRPAQPPLRMNTGVSDKVSRPYSKYMADTCTLSHYLNGSNPRSRLRAAGFTSGSWGENVASPAGLSASALANVEIFFQSESHFRGNNHYTNIMSKYFGSAGVGIWVSRCVRLTVDFYA